MVLAEDDPDIRGILRHVFTRRGYVVWAACNGAEAFQLAVRHGPDVIVTDVAMPGMDGLQLSAAIRRHPELKDTPVIVLSGTLDVDDDQALTNAAPCEVLFKPQHHQQLLAAVQRWVVRGHHCHDRPGLRSQSCTTDGPAQVSTAQQGEFIAATPSRTSLRAG